MKAIKKFFKPETAIQHLKLPQVLYSPQHEFITYPKNRISYLGISDYAKRCLTAQTIKIRPAVSATIRQSILYFKGNMFSTDEDPLSMLTNIPQSFIIRKGEYLLTMESKDTDWQLTAPVDLRVLKINNHSFDECIPFNIFKWILQIEVIDEKQVEELLTPDEYQKMWKIISHQ